MPQKLEPAGTPKPTGRNHQHAGWCVGCQSVHEWDIKPADCTAADVAWAEAGYKHTPRPKDWFPNARLLKKLFLYPFDKPATDARPERSNPRSSQYRPTAGYNKNGLPLYTDYVGAKYNAKWGVPEYTDFSGTQSPQLFGGGTRTGRFGFGPGKLNENKMADVPFAPARLALYVLRARDVVKKYEREPGQGAPRIGMWTNLVKRAEAVVTGWEVGMGIPVNLDRPLAQEVLRVRDDITRMVCITPLPLEWGFIVSMAQNTAIAWAHGLQSPASETPNRFYPAGIDWAASRSYRTGDVVEPNGKVSEAAKSPVLGLCDEVPVGPHIQRKFCSNWKPLETPKPPEVKEQEPVLGYCDYSCLWGTCAHKNNGGRSSWR